MIEREPWLREHLEGRTSVTELEILHGVLNNPKMADHAFFYFRDPAYAVDPALTPDERRDMVERDIWADVKRYGEAEATRRTEERKAKLAALKQRIRDSKLPLVEPYADPKAMAEIVRKEFDDLIDRLYPEDQVPDPLAQERMAHEAHAKNKLFACIDRPAHLAALNAFAAPVDHGGQGLVITGESGGGKTALLAAWARAWAKNHSEDFLFQHYFGATPDSASPEGFLRRLLGELKSRFGITDEIPTDPEKLRDALPLWLAHTIGKGRVVLVLDGLNQVQGSEPDRRLRFLPEHFPPHVAALASALPGLALDALRQRGWAEHDLPRASGAEVDAMVGEYLKIHARTLEPALRRELITALGATNPLFLRTVLDELRQFGNFERLPQRVRYYLEAGNPKDLFLRVLTRWQEDFDARDPAQDSQKADIVRRGLTYLWAARQGLSEPEWLDLLGVPGQSFPRALWTPLFLTLEPHLSQRGGLFAFGHDFLRQAVEAAFVPSADLQRAAHLSVANYFERHPQQQEITPRKAAEWPFQFHAAAAWDRLEACLTDIPLFLALHSDKTKWELTGYWQALRRLGRDMGECYSTAYDRWIAVPVNAGDHYASSQLGHFLSDNGLYPAAKGLLMRAVSISESVQGREHPETLESVNNLAVLLHREGDHAGAERLHRRALEARERVLGPDHPETLTSLNNLAILLESQGEYECAEQLSQRAVSTSERVQGREHPETLQFANNLAHVLKSRGKYADAESLYQQTLSVRERVSGQEHPHTLTIMNNLAVLLEKQGKYARAEPLCRRSLEASERVLGPEHPHTLNSLNNLAVLLELMGNLVGAEPLFRQVLEARERVQGPDHPDTLQSVNNLAICLYSQGNYADAEPLLQRALEARERLLGPDHPDTLSSVNSLAWLRMRSDYASAESLNRRALEACERLLGLDHPDTLLTLHNLAAVLDRKGDDAGAEALYRRALKARECVLGQDHPDTLASVNNLAGLLYRKSDYAGAEPLYRRALAACGSVLGPEHPDTIAALNRLAVDLESMDAFDEAEAEYRKALQRAPNDVVVLGNYAMCLQNARQDFPGARDLYLRALQGDPSDAINHTNYAGLCVVMGATGEAEEHLREAWRLAAGKPNGYTTRTLFLRAALAATRRQDPALYLGQLKAIFDKGIQPMPSRNASVREHLRRDVPAEQFALLDAIYAAINEPDGFARLSALPAWQAIPPRPLDEPWP